MGQAIQLLAVHVDRQPIDRWWLGATAAKDKPIKGLFACGELVGGVFFNGYPGGSGLTSGAVFGRIAGYGSVQEG